MLRGFIGGFSSRYDLREALVVYGIDSPIGRIDFIVSRPPPQAERNNRCNARVVPGRFLSLFLDFLVSKDPPSSPFFPRLHRRPSLCLFLPSAPPARSRPSRSEGTDMENNKADHVTQVQMRRNYTSGTVVPRTKYLFQYNIYDSQPCIHPTVFPLHPRGKCSAAPSVNRAPPPERIKNTSLIVNDGPRISSIRDYCTGELTSDYRVKVENREPRRHSTADRIFHRSPDFDTYVSHVTRARDK